MLSARQGEQALVAIGIPLLILVFFSLVDVLPTGTDDPIDQLAPAVLALAIMSSAMVSLGIATGFERYYGVLKRLGATPLGRPRLLGAKLSAVLAVEVLQLVVLMVVARLLGWDPQVQPLGLIAAVLAGHRGVRGARPGPGRRAVGPRQPGRLQRALPAPAPARRCRGARLRAAGGARRGGRDACRPVRSWT